MGTDSEVRQRKGTKEGAKTKDAITGEVVKGEELVTSGLKTLENIKNRLSNKVSRNSQQRCLSDRNI